MAETKDTKAPAMRPRPVEWVPPAPQLTWNEECAATGQRSYTGRQTALWQVLARKVLK